MSSQPNTNEILRLNVNRAFEGSRLQQSLFHAAMTTEVPEMAKCLNKLSNTPNPIAA